MTQCAWNYRQELENTITSVAKAYQNLILQIDYDFEPIAQLLSEATPKKFNLEKITKLNQKYISSKASGLLSRLGTPISSSLIDISELKLTHDRLVRESRGRKFIDENAAEALYDNLNMSLNMSMNMSKN